MASTPPTPPAAGPPVPPQPAGPASPPPDPNRPGGLKRTTPPSTVTRVRVAAVVAAAIAAGLVIWLVTKGGGGGSHAKSPAQVRAIPVAATIPQLRALAATKAHPIYWAGPKSRYTYELTQTGDGKVYVRYLPAGVRVGVNVPNYVTVATYPATNGFATVTQASHLPGEYVRRLRGGGLAVASPRLPKSVYLSFPRAQYLVEVYDPVPNQARALVLSGQVRPIR